MDEPAIKVDKLNKIFKLPHEKQTSIKGLLINFGYNKYELQQALKDVSFEVKKGEFFGIIGRNGSGKSTLLKILAGIYVPSSGKVKINGKLTPFIELGVGFNPELTGRENVFLNGALLGFTRPEMLNMYKDIVEFAELERFMDQKLKNYSSGMQVRLAFSIAIRAKSDILLIDEVLAVGDENFQKKCFEVFEKLKREGRTIVFVSHAMSNIRDFCDRAILIHDGNLIEGGDVEKVIQKYHALNRNEESTRLTGENLGKVKAPDDDIRFIAGNDSVRIPHVKVYDHNKKQQFNLETGKSFYIEFEAQFLESVDNPVYAVMFRKDPKQNLFGINSFFNKKKSPRQPEGTTAQVHVEGKMILSPGTYYLTIAVSNQRKRSQHTDLILMNNHFKINVYGDEDTWGLIPNDARIKVS